jgi:cold shock CspA family protein
LIRLSETIVGDVALLSVPELNLGSIDGVSYRQRENKEFLRKTLYREHYLHKVMAHNRYFVIGEKGTGKTSYAVFLEGNDYENTRAKVIELNSTDYQKFIGLKESGRLSLSSYSDVWRVLLLLLMTDTVANKASETVFNFHKFNALRNAISQYYNDAFRPEVDTSLELIQESEKALGLMSQLAKAGSKDVTKTTSATTNFQLNLLSLQRQFETALSSLKLDKDIILFIDGIDIRPADISFSHYIQCIQGLANAAWQVNTEFFSNIKDSPGRMKVCLLMRPDILDQMGFQNLNAKVRDNGVVLNWQTTYEEFRSSAIFKMVSGILARQQDPPAEIIDSWKHYFPYDLQNQMISEKKDDPFIGFLRYSFYRPRDVIQYLILMQEYVAQHQNEKQHFTERAFHRCEREFSDYLLGEVRDYLSFYYSSFDFDQITGFFSMLNGKNNFTWEEFAKAFERYKSQLPPGGTTVDELRGAPEAFLQFLYSLNILGYVERDELGTNFVHWCFRDRTPVKLRPQVKYDLAYTVHPGLARSLLVGRTAVSARPPRRSDPKPRAANRKSNIAPDGRVNGTILLVNPSRGFAFAQVDGSREDVYVSLKSAAKGLKLKKGQKVSFSLETSAEGKLRARELSLA